MSLRLYSSFITSGPGHETATYRILHPSNKYTAQKLSTAYMFAGTIFKLELFFDEKTDAPPLLMSKA